VDWGKKFCFALLIAHSSNLFLNRGFNIISFVIVIFMLAWLDAIESFGTLRPLVTHHQQRQQHPRRRLPLRT
jgi:Na+/H+ antiporter NhaC